MKGKVSPNGELYFATLTRGNQHFSGLLSQVRTQSGTHPIHTGCHRNTALFPQFHQWLQATGGEAHNAAPAVGNLNFGFFHAGESCQLRKQIGLNGIRDARLMGFLALKVQKPTSTY